MSCHYVVLEVCCLFLLSGPTLLCGWALGWTLALVCVGNVEALCARYLALFTMPPAVIGLQALCEWQGGAGLSRAPTNSSREREKRAAAEHRQQYQRCIQ